MNLTLLGRNYSLYTHVHHTYGLNDAFDKSVAYLLSAQMTQHLDKSTEALLEDSIQHKPLDQDDTVNTATDTADKDTMPDSSGIDTVADNGGRRALQRQRVTESYRAENDPAVLKDQHELPNRSEGAALDQSHRFRQDSRSLLQDDITVEHPCLHQGYSQEYTWVAHGAHVAPLPRVQLLGR